MKTEWKSKQLKGINWNNDFYLCLSVINVLKFVRCVANIFMFQGHGM